MIDIRGMDKASVLMALYEKARCQGMGRLAFVEGPLPREEAEEMVRTQTYFDYVKGRVLKVDLSRDWLDTALYNRDNGPGAAEDAIMDFMTRPD